MNANVDTRIPPEPGDLEDILERLHIGTLQREKLRARRSILVDEDAPPLSYHEAELLTQQETFSVTSEESPKDSKKKRKTSGTSSKDSGLGKESSPQLSIVRSKTLTETKSKDQEVQTTIGKGYKYNKLQDVYAAEEGKLYHGKNSSEEKPQKKASKMSKIFRPKKGPPNDENYNIAADMSLPIPQIFIVKYMGSRPTKGYGGAKYTQGPIEEIIEAVNQLPKGSDLPLVKLELTYDSVNLSPHKRNKIKSYESLSIPIQYISYGSQDQNYPRIFSMIIIREMSAKSRKLDCHVYACDSSKNSRKLAGLLAYVFEVYRERMEGKPLNFVNTIHPLYGGDGEDDIKSSCDV